MGTQAINRDVVVLPFTAACTKLFLCCVLFIPFSSSFASGTESWTPTKVIDIPSIWFSSEQATYNYIIKDISDYDSCLIYPSIATNGTADFYEDVFVTRYDFYNCGGFPSTGKTFYVAHHLCLNGAYWNDNDHACETPPDPNPLPCFSSILTDDGNGQCGMPSVVTRKNQGCCTNNDKSIERQDPVNIGIGNMFHEETDYQSAALHGLKYTRYYNSADPGFGNKLGYGWSANYWQIIVDVDANTVDVRRPDNKYLRFNLTGGKWLPDSDVFDSLEELTDGQGNRTGWKLILSDKSIETYHYDGVKVSRLTSITTSDGFTTQVNYDLPSTEGGDDNNTTIDKIIGPFGREMTFTYTGTLVHTMTDPAGRVYSYNYNSKGNLVSVTYPDNTPSDPDDNPKRIYHYDELFHPYALTGITDENGNRVASWDYDDRGRVIMSEHAGGAQHAEFSYKTVDGTVTVTDGLGHVSTTTLGLFQNVFKPTAVDGPCEGCSDYQSITYDSNGFVTSRTDYNGNTTTYVHNSRGLETSRTEAAGTPQERTVTTEWSPDFRLPTKITEPGKIITFTYDNQGRLLERKETAQ